MPQCAPQKTKWKNSFRAVSCFFISSKKPIAAAVRGCPRRKPPSLCSRARVRKLYSDRNENGKDDCRRPATRIRRLASHDREAGIQGTTSTGGKGTPCFLVARAATSWTAGQKKKRKKKPSFPSPSITITRLRYAQRVALDERMARRRVEDRIYRIERAI
ncbi:hypothetical protein VTK73DRAFT_10122 [Phialemonium thermophilum]|uniref:Uncharacterized protein n=1 Tax=Phialemonium thermophilum TaxID=223376 RepID=A0ABR3VYG1_9PEZI